MDGNATFDRYREQAANQGAAKAPPPKRHAPQVPTPDLVSAVDLLAKDFKPVKWTIPGLLPVGVTLLAGAPKTGKSWLVLDFGIAVASGGAVLGKVQVDPGAVLYLALEDNQRRLKSRLSKRLGGAPAPDGMTFSTVWPRLDQGAIDRLADWLAEHPDTALIVLDTLARIRPPSKGRDSLYTDGVDSGSTLQAPGGVGSGECGTGWNQWNRIPENQGTRLVTCRTCGHWQGRCAEGENATDPEFLRTCPKFTALITREAAA